MTTLPDFGPFLNGVEPSCRRLFVTVSGSHLYGFPSADSDYDLRGAFVRPTKQLLGLTNHSETIEAMETGDNPNDVVLHEAGKYARLLLEKNGYVLEQITSPLVIETSGWHEELIALAPACVNVRSLGHYLGFSSQQIALMRRRPDKQVKILLYIFRVLLTGIHLANTGIVEANLLRLNETFKLSFIDELVAQKIARENSELAGDRPLEFFVRQYEVLLAQLEGAKEWTSLPTAPPARIAGALEDWLVRLRMDALEPEPRS